MSPRTEERFIVSEESLEIRWNQHELERRCKISFDLLRGVRIITEPWKITSGAIPDLTDRYFVRRKNAEPFEALATSIPCEISDEGMQVALHLVPRFQPVFIDETPELQSVEFTIPNFGDFFVQRVGEGGLKNRIEMGAGGWIFRIYPLRESNFGDLSAAENMSFSFTHAGHLAREKDESFSCAQAHEVVNAIGEFLSFCRGRFIALALVKGYDGAGHVVMQEWGTRTVDPFSEGATWLDRMQAQEMEHGFAGFLSKALDTEWREALYESVYW